MLLKVKKLIIGHHQALTPAIDFTLEAGQSLSLGGPNGVGKSTLLKVLAGLKPPISGSYLWQDKIRLSYLAQELELDPLFPLNVQDFLKMGQLFKPSLEAQKWQGWQELILNILNLQNIQRASFHELSGGQKQVCGLARALRSQPQVLLLDEPFNHLDSKKT
ncbi:MAG: ATP-binding cassette domain-containing protein, partial [Deltaproteobacteria bacterium]|nr:ATP-binding cassette domain-containing protein [Deltaproteobacteria bacterium]